LQDLAFTHIVPDYSQTIKKKHAYTSRHVEPQWAKVATANDMSHKELVDMQVL
jgi:hypothetical protein